MIDIIFIITFILIFAGIFGAFLLLYVILHKFSKEHHDNKDVFNYVERDRDGFDRSGKDWLGYYRNGYNDEGIDRGGFDREYYLHKAETIQTLLDEAHRQMKQNEFEYALLNIRKGLERGIRCVITHWAGKIYNDDDNLIELIFICSKRCLFEDDYIDQLHHARKHCNDALHDTETEKEYRQVYFAYKVLEDLMLIVKNISVI